MPLAPCHQNFEQLQAHAPKRLVRQVIADALYRVIAAAGRFAGARRCEDCLPTVLQKSSDELLLKNGCQHSNTAWAYHCDGLRSRIRVRCEIQMRRFNWIVNTTAAIS